MRPLQLLGSPPRAAPKLAQVPHRSRHRPSGRSQALLRPRPRPRPHPRPRRRGPKAARPAPWPPGALPRTVARRTPKPRPGPSLQMSPRFRGKATTLESTASPSPISNASRRCHPLAPPPSRPQQPPRLRRRSGTHRPAIRRRHGPVVLPPPSQHRSTIQSPGRTATRITPSSHNSSSPSSSRRTSSSSSSPPSSRTIRRDQLWPRPQQGAAAAAG